MKHGVTRKEKHKNTKAYKKSVYKKPTVKILEIREIKETFSLKCHSQTFAAFDMFGLILRKFRKFKSLHRENEELDVHKTWVSSLFKLFPIL